MKLLPSSHDFILRNYGIFPSVLSSFLASNCMGFRSNACYDNNTENGNLNGKIMGITELMFIINQYGKFSILYITYLCSSLCSFNYYQFIFSAYIIQALS